MDGSKQGRRCWALEGRTTYMAWAVCPMFMLVVPPSNSKVSVRGVLGVRSPPNSEEQHAWPGPWPWNRARLNSFERGGPPSTAKNKGGFH